MFAIRSITVGFRATAIIAGPAAAVAFADTPWTVTPAADTPWTGTDDTPWT